ncbi:hypothetical protein V8F20_003425 [Naviculisporaceae sp. PSN 640]
MFGHQSWGEGDTDDNVRHGKKESFSANGSRPGVLARDWTLEISNLPSGVTLKELMKGIAIAGGASGFGRVYSVHLSNDFIPALGRAEPIARIAFHNKTSAYHFKQYIVEQGLCLSGQPIKVDWTSNLVPEMVEMSGINHSRALIIDGPPSLTRRNITDALQQNGIAFSDVEMLEFVINQDKTVEAYILFFTYAKASSIMWAFTHNFSSNGIKTSWARDPVETGVKTTYEYQGNLGETEGQLKMIWGQKDWRIKKDPKALGPYSDSDSSDWVRNENSKKKDRRMSKSGGRSGYRIDKR